MFHFYCFNSEKKIIISDQPVEKIKKKFGYRYEILTSAKEKASLEFVKERIHRSYPDYIIEMFLGKSPPVFTEETRKKISESKLGKPRDEQTRAKISAALKGRSNFQGKKHSDETKAMMAQKKLGNQHNKDLIWAHNPRGDEEIKVKDLKQIPKGYSKGRDYYSTEPGLYYFLERIKLKSRS